MSFQGVWMFRNGFLRAGYLACPEKGRNSQPCHYKSKEAGKYDAEDGIAGSIKCSPCTKCRESGNDGENKKSEPNHLIPQDMEWLDDGWNYGLGKCANLAKHDCDSYVVIFNVDESEEG